MAKFWKKECCRLLNEHRNYVSGQCLVHVKKYVVKHGRASFPTLGEIMRVAGRDVILLPLKQDASDEEKAAHERLMHVAVWFVNCILANVAGASKWFRTGIRQ